MTTVKEEAAGIGARLEWVRRQRSMTQTEMARALGLSLRGYQRYEREERDFPVELFQALMRLGIHPHWLVTGQGEPFTSRDQTPIHLREPDNRSAPQHGDKSTFDPDLMTNVIRMALEAVSERKATPDPDALAGACVAIYELSRRAGTQPSRDAVLRLTGAVRQQHGRGQLKRRDQSKRPGAMRPGT